MISSKKALSLTVAIICSILALAVSSPQEKSYAKLIFPNGRVVTAEIAKTEEERARGLMFRDRLGENEGMLFIFEEPDFYSFWMKNMKFPIDIIWLSEEKRIVYIASRVPPCKREPCPTYQPYSKALYVIEVPAGFAEREKLKRGDRVEIIFLPNKK